jgi:hypothetical protein
VPLPNEQPQALVFGASQTLEPRELDCGNPGNQDRTGVIKTECPKHPDQPSVVDSKGVGEGPVETHDSPGDIANQHR